MSNSHTSVHQSRLALNVLRVVVALFFIAHGGARIGLGIVDDFGAFLNDVGFPLGLVLAWMITATEIGGGVLLALGKGTRLLAFYFAAELVMGIVLVHAQEGWFVVGAGRNGMEYSVLLITVLLAIGYGTGPGRESGDKDGTAPGRESGDKASGQGQGQ